MKKSKVLYDEGTDSLYIYNKSGKEIYFEEIKPNIIIEYDKKNQPLAIEI